MKSTGEVMGRGTTFGEAFGKALPNASPNVVPLPITSPVDFISGPKIGSTFLNLLNGKTGALTA